MWSKELIKITREMLSKMPMAMMKNIDGFFGVLLLQDGKYVITDRTLNEKYVFESIDALIEAGWAVD